LTVFAHASIRKFKGGNRLLLVRGTNSKTFSDANTAVCMSNQAGLRIDAYAIVMNQALERE
jgi:hypothetical protein